MQHNFQGLGEKVMLLNARRITQKIHGQHLILLAIEDITEHRQAEKIISEREAWFRNMADNAPVMIWVTGVDKLCTFANKSFLEFRGITLEQAIGRPWYDGAHPDDVEQCVKAFNESFEEKKALELTYRAHHKKRDYREVLIRAKPNFTSEGLFTGFIGSCVEVPGT